MLPEVILPIIMTLRNLILIRMLKLILINNYHRLKKWWIILLIKVWIKTNTWMNIKTNIKDGIITVENIISSPE